MLLQLYKLQAVCAAMRVTWDDHEPVPCAGTCKGKIVKIRKMAAHGGLAFGKDSSQKLHDMKQEAKRKLKLQDKQRKRKKAKLQAL